MKELKISPIHIGRLFPNSQVAFFGGVYISRGGEEQEAHVLALISYSKVRDARLAINGHKLGTMYVHVSRPHIDKVKFSQTSSRLIGEGDPLYSLMADGNTYEPPEELDAFFQISLLYSDLLRKGLTAMNRPENRAARNELVEMSAELRELKDFDPKRVEMQERLDEGFTLLAEDILQQNLYQR